MQLLHDAKFDLVMITGDNLLTAIAVGKQLKFHQSEAIMEIKFENNKYFFENH